MTAYYNEIDPYAAQWLRNLIDAGHIAPGIVDERSIEDVYPSDLRGFTQCHFFAGIGIWSRALRSAGWGDDRPVWTGSCPCQPFSQAGKGAAFDDERHLWPAFHHLISQCRPVRVFGEQVDGKDGLAWLDLVQADLEGIDYACAPIVFPSAGIGSPQIRHRLYWVADADNKGLEGRRSVRKRAAERLAGASSLAGGLAHHTRGGRREERADVGRSLVGNRSEGIAAGSVHGRGAGRLADPDFARLCGEQGLRLRRADIHDADGRRPVSGFWADADWLPCRDGKWRPVEPGTFPLAHGAAARVGRLRAYGNAINAEAARVFIEAVSEALA